MRDLVTPVSIQAAARALAGIAVRTPLLESPWLSETTGHQVRLKCENLQRAGAFKIRGAYTMISRLPAEARERGVVAYSSGNHAQGVALAARLYGIRAVVVMPTTAPRVKIEGARRLGAEVVLEGTTSIERQRRAEAIAAEQGLAIVPGFDHADIIAGQGSAGIEILEDWPDVDTVLVPVGGGGLISGIAAWLKTQRPELQMIGVEPEKANAMARSLEAGEPVTIDVVPTVADGLMPVRPGDLTYAHAREFVDRMVTVTDEAIIDATRGLLLNTHLVCEFSGAATVAALLTGAIPGAGRRVAAVISGGNIEPARMAELVAPRAEPEPAHA